MLDYGVTKVPVPINIIIIDICKDRLHVCLHRCFESMGVSIDACIDALNIDALSRS